jgi:type IV pilus assembly protein PilB
MINMGVEPFLISSSVILVAAQRLVRQICPNCKESYKADESLIKKLDMDGLKTPLTLYRGRGCKTCNNTGYKGRIGLIETLKLSSTMKELITNKVPENRIKAEARKEGMKTLRENGVVKALAGITTLEEIIRVTAGDQDIDM